MKPCDDSVEFKDVAVGTCLWALGWVESRGSFFYRPGQVTLVAPGGRRPTVWVEFSDAIGGGASVPLAHCKAMSIVDQVGSLEEG